MYLISPMEMVHQGASGYHDDRRLAEVLRGAWFELDGIFGVILGWNEGIWVCLSMASKPRWYERDE